MWQETKHGLYRRFMFDDFKQAFAFMGRVAIAAESANHHPRWQNEWNKVDIWINTHSANMKITDKDRDLANTISTLVKEPHNLLLESKVDENTTNLTEVKLYTDGGSRGNPGPSASGYVLLDMQDNVILAAGEYIGITTNNQAEYQALKLGLEMAVHRGIKAVHVFMDSMLVVNQMKNIYKIRNRDLWPIHDSINHLLPKFEQITFTQVPREHNKLADKEVNKALDAAITG